MRARTIVCFTAAGAAAALAVLLAPEPQGLATQVLEVLPGLAPADLLACALWAIVLITAVLAIEAGAMRRTLRRLETHAGAPPSEVLIERLVTAIEESNRLLREGSVALSAAADSLAQTMRQSSDAIERASRAIPEPSTVLASAAGELQGVGEQLARSVRTAAAAARTLRTAVAKSVPPARSNGVAATVEPRPEIGRELRQLLGEFH